MNQPKRASITDELLQELNIIATGNVLDQIAIRRVEARAEGLKTNQPASYYLVMGVCACVRGEKTKLIENFNRAVLLDPGAQVLDNYSLSLQYVGEYNLLIEQSRQFVKKFPHDPSVLKTAWSWFREYAAIPDLLETERLIKNIKADENVAYDTAAVSEALSARNLKHEDLTSVLVAARDFLRGKGLFHAISNNYYSSSEIDPIVSIRYIFEKDVDELFDLEVELMKALIDRQLPAYDKNAVCVYLGNHNDRVVLDVAHAI